MFDIFFPKMVPLVRQFGKNMVDPDRLQMTIWRKRKTCCTTKSTDINLLLFHCNNGCMKVRYLSYLIHITHVSFVVLFVT
jgi:hypothetical protein